MGKTIEDDEVVFEGARDIFQNDALIGSYIMYASLSVPPPRKPVIGTLVIGVVSKLYHVDTGDLYKIGVAVLEEHPEQGTSEYYLDYPEDDFVVLADAVIGKIASDQTIHTRFFTSRMYELRQEIVNDTS